MAAPNSDGHAPRHRWAGRLLFRQHATATCSIALASRAAAQSLAADAITLATSSGCLRVAVAEQAIDLRAHHCQPADRIRHCDILPRWPPPRKGMRERPACLRGSKAETTATHCAPG